MKSYLKMSDVFGGCVISNIFREIKCECDVVVAVAKTGSAAQAISHAINSHDELVQMNQELLAALESVIEWYDMEADHSIEPDFYKRMAACQASEDMVREAIAKVKRGAA